MRSSAWSTKSVTEADRFGFWNDVICDAVLNVEAQSPAPGAFDAELSCNHLSFGRVVRCSSGPHRVERSARMLRSKPSDAYLVSLQLSGRCHVSQGGTQFTLDAGDIGVVNAARAMRLTFEERVERMIAVIPRHSLEAACGWLSPGTAVRLPRGRATTRVLSALLAEMGAPDAELREDEESVLSESFLSLFRSSGAPMATTPAGDGLRARVLAFMRDNLGDPDLSPGLVATGIGISERSVHVVFARTGTTCRRWLIEERLKRAASALRAPDWSSASISEIAFRTGFSDLSHFSRRFRQKFGSEPSAYRSSGASAPQL